MSAVLARPLPPRRLSDERAVLRATAQKRMMIMMLLYGAAIGVVLAKLAFFAISTGSASAATMMGRVSRADIVDRNGSPLARTIDTWAIGVHPDQILGDRQEIAQRLAGILGVDEGKLYAQLVGKRFAYIERNASASLVTEVNAIGEPAIVFERDRQRLYPQSELAAQALGFLDMEGRGASGMERALDGKLTTNGAPEALSIDARVQSAMENELGQAVLSFKAKGGAGVVLDVKTGEIMALASFPTFNPNKPGDAPLPPVDASGKPLAPGPFYNRATSAAYELGSTFKPITVAAAIDSGAVTSMARRFDATVPLAIDRFLIHDDRGDEQRRWLNIPETLIYSSNIATARIADDMGGDKLSAMFRAMDFDKPMPFELPARGNTLFPAKFTRITTMTTAYGHGIAVTPMHLAAAYAALVNGGIWHPVTMLKVTPGAQVSGRRVISEQTSARMRQLLRLIVTDGTGRSANVPGYRVGGKTGTAEVATAGGYSKKANVSTFAAAFPMDAPRYVVVVMIDSPVAAVRTAAYTAAPVVSRFILRAGPMLGVVPDPTRDIDVSELTPLIWHRAGEKPQNMADPE
jgi:cell division protein FtsI (penicillin-binding protein 3)